MPKKDAPETSEEIKAQIEQASQGLTFEGIESSEETEESKSGEEEAQTEEPETSTEEPETPEEEGSEEEPQPKLHQIKVDGKIEYVTEEKLIEYAQKGRFLERERAKDKSQSKDEPNWETLDKQIIEKIKTQGFARTMAEFNSELLKSDKTIMQETRKQARTLADNSEWGKQVSLREEFMDRVLTGEDPEVVNIEMSAKYWEGVARQGEAIGGEKERRKQAAQIAKGKETVPREEAPSEASTLKDFGKLVEEGAGSDKLAEVMKKAGVSFLKDNL